MDSLLGKKLNFLVSGTRVTHLLVLENRTSSYRIRERSNEYWSGNSSFSTAIYVCHIFNNGATTYYFTREIVVWYWSKTKNLSTNMYAIFLIESEPFG